MVAHQRIAHRRGPLCQAWIQVLTTESHLRLSDRRLEATQVSDAIKASRLFQGQAVEFQHLLQSEVSRHASRR